MARHKVLVVLAHLSISYLTFLGTFRLTSSQRKGNSSSLLL